MGKNCTESESRDDTVSTFKRIRDGVGAKRRRCLKGGKGGESQEEGRKKEIHIMERGAPGHVPKPYSGKEGSKRARGDRREWEGEARKPSSTP